MEFLLEVLQRVLRRALMMIWFSLWFSLRFVALRMPDKSRIFKVRNEESSTRLRL